jgi:hypothetical protein
LTLAPFSAAGFQFNTDNGIVNEAQSAINGALTDPALAVVQSGKAP